jgi:[amino group carrier protein]-lysine/ornithine hydrolase
MNTIPETLFNLVKIYSPSGSEQAAVKYLVGRMQALHFTQAVADGAGNAVGVMGDGPRQVVLIGHIDTVPGEIQVRVEPSPPAPPPRGEGSEISPLTLLPVGEGPNTLPLTYLPPGEGKMVLYGRGSVDAKGPLASFVEGVAACGPLPGWQMVVIGAVGEEADSPGARHVVSRYHPEYAIIGEPSCWERVTLGYKGSARFELSVRRLMMHSARQDESASEAVIRAWETIKARAAAFNLERERIFDRLLVSIQGMDSGGDGFEEWACLRVGTRLPPDLAPEAWYGRLESDEGLSDIAGLAIKPVGFPVPAYSAEKNTPLVRAFLQGIRKSGGQPGFVLKSGTSDMNFLAPAWGCPALAYGPGDSALDHTPDEHISLDEYGRAVEVLQAVLKQICQGS